MLYRAVVLIVAIAFIRLLDEILKTVGNRKIDNGTIGIYDLAHDPMSSIMHTNVKLAYLFGFNFIPRYLSLFFDHLIKNTGIKFKIHVLYIFTFLVIYLHDRTLLITSITVLTLFFYRTNVKKFPVLQVVVILRFQAGIAQ